MLTVLTSLSPLGGTSGALPCPQPRPWQMRRLFAGLPLLEVSEWAEVTPQNLALTLTLPLPLPLPLPLTLTLTLTLSLPLPLPIP